MTLSPSSIIPIVISQVFERIKDRINQNQCKELSTSDLEELHTLFGLTLVKAFNILENKVITSYKSENKLREIIEIPGEIVYKIFPNVNFCMCETFQFDVLTEKQYTCEHILAAKLAGLLGNIEEVKLTNDQFNYLIKNLFENCISN